MVAHLYSYTFVPATKELTLKDIQIVDIAKIQYIINTTRGVTLYNYSSPTLLTTDGTNIITLSASTAGMLYTDEFDITYDISESGSGGGVTSVAASGGSTGMSYIGSPIVSSGTITLSGTLNETHGGTGLTTYTLGDIIYASATNVLSKLPIGTNGKVLTISGGVPTWQTPTGGSGILSLNTLTGTTQTFATGTSGTNFAISSSGTVHTFNLPIASGTNTGKLSSTDWTTFNNKQPAGAYLTSIAGQDLSTADNTTSQFITGAAVPANETDPVFTASQANNITGTDITNLSNLSGTNSGDQTSIVGITGVKTEFNTALTDGDFLYVGDVTSMTYPGAGIALSTGSAWGTSITDNSTNWNTAYSQTRQWDGGATGLTAATGRTSLGLVIGTDVLAPSGSGASLTGLTATQVGLGNVTNESKATMFTNATFTGTFATAAGAIANVALANSAVANLSGTNTGDQTTISGNAGSATILQTSRTIWGQSFNGSANVTGDITLGASNIVSTGSLGSTGAGKLLKLWSIDIESTNMPTVGGTSLSSTFSPIAGSASILTVGTIGTGTWQGTVIGSTYGGTGINNAGRTLTINTNSGTLAFSAASKTLTVANTLTLSGTDSSTLNIGAGGTLGTAAFTASTAYAASGLATASGLTLSTARILGRTTAATGAIEEISVGATLSLAATTLGVVSSPILTTARTISGTGEATFTTTAFDGSAAVSGTVTLTNSAVIGKVLTGYVSGAGTVAATDTILQAFQKLNGNDALKAPLASPTFTGTVTLPAGQVVNGVTLTTGGGTTNFLRADGTYAAPAGGGSPGGSSTQVQYNNAGAFAGTSGATATSTKVTLVLPGINNVDGSYTTTATAAGTTTLTVSSNYLQYFTGTTTQTVVMPDATTLTVGMGYKITNNSTGLVTVNMNGGSLIKVLAASSTIVVTVTGIGSAAGTWVSEYSTDLAIGDATATSITYPNGGRVWATQGAYVQADFTLSAASGVQSAFPTTMDVFNAEASTMYRVRGRYILNTGATTHTTAMAFALGGGASVTNFQYTTLLWSAADNTLTTTQSTTHVSGVASKVLNATSTAVYTIIEFNGLLRMNAAGTITPQINFSANPTGTNLMKVGSYIEFEKMGSDTMTFFGNFS